MGRLVRVVLYAIVVLILYFWVVSLLKSYKQNQDLKNAGNEIIEDTILQNVDDSLSINQDIILNDSTPSRDQVYEKIDKTIEQLSVQPVTGNVSEKPKEEKPEVKQESKENQVKASPQGKYMVIAGSFIKEENARDQLKKLKALGYSKAEIKIFISSEYHSVIVSRHSSSGEAEKVVQNLKKNGVESFVKEKKD